MCGEVQHYISLVPQRLIRLDGPGLRDQLRPESKFVGGHLEQVPFFQYLLFLVFFPFLMNFGAPCHTQCLGQRPWVHTFQMEKEPCYDP